MSSKVTYKGLGACRGTATGIAKLPNDPTFKEGDILVAEMTVPDNVPIMKKASAIATDRGSVTCHASIVARELGIPCVVNTRRATSLVGNTVTITVKEMKDAKNHMIVGDIKETE